ncbi:MAG: hypothetical protein KAW89_02320 [Armatimonadetes bacterium]|nr:hypothetical protein [Armatimonadota bacterium]
MASTQGHSKTNDSSGQVLSWRVWLPRRRPLLSVTVAALVVVLTTAVAVIYGGPFYPLLTAVVLTAAVSAHYAPVRFTLDSEGITVASFWGARQKLWSNLKTYWPNRDDAVSVSASERRSLLTSARDLYLYIEGNRAEVLEYLSRHLSPAKRDEYA